MVNTLKNDSKKEDTKSCYIFCLLTGFTPWLHHGLGPTLFGHSNPSPKILVKKHVLSKLNTQNSLCTSNISFMHQWKFLPPSLFSCPNALYLTLHQMPLLKEPSYPHVLLYDLFHLIYFLITLYFSCPF